MTGAWMVDRLLKKGEESERPDNPARTLDFVRGEDRCHRLATKLDDRIFSNGRGRFGDGPAACCCESNGPRLWDPGKRDDESGFSTLGRERTKVRRVFSNRNVSGGRAAGRADPVGNNVARKARLRAREARRESLPKGFRPHLSSPDQATWKIDATSITSPGSTGPASNDSPDFTVRNDSGPSWRRIDFEAGSTIHTANTPLAK